MSTHADALPPVSGKSEYEIVVRLKEVPLLRGEYDVIAYVGDEPVGVRSFASTHKDFPHETTADQWFTESQFESYRALGLHTVELACASLGAPTDANLRPRRTRRAGDSWWA